MLLGALSTPSSQLRSVDSGGMACKLHNLAVKIGVKQRSFDLFNLPTVYRLTCLLIYLYHLVHTVFIISYSSELINAIL